MITKPFELDTSVGIIRGISTIPDSGKYPVLFMLHGFTGEMNGPKYLMKRFGEIASAAGIAVVKFDHIGCGNSEGPFTKNNISSSIAGAHEVIEHFTKEFQTDEIYLQGFSMGGMIALELAKQYPDKIKKILLWSPAFNMADIMKQIYGNSPRIDQTTVDYFGIEITKSLWDDTKKYDSYEYSSKNTEICIIVGGNDDVVPPRVPRRGYDNFQCKKEFHIVEGAIHTYDDLNQRKQLYDLSLNFLINGIR